MTNFLTYSLACKLGTSLETRPDQAAMYITKFFDI